MDILNMLRHGGGELGNAEVSYDRMANAKSISFKPLTLTEMLDSQIAFHEKKITDLKEAKAAISPEVERALNALAKL